MKAQKHHPRICIREQKGRHKGQECEDLTTRLCAETLLLQGTIGFFGSDWSKLVGDVLKRCRGIINPHENPWNKTNLVYVHSG